MSHSLSVIIVNWNTRHDLHACLSALQQHPYTRGTSEIIVVDNGSHDNSAQMVHDQFPDVILLANAENELYAHATNEAISRAVGDAYLLLNPDVRVTPHSLNALVTALFADDRIGAVAPRLQNPDGSTQRSIRGFPYPKAVLCDILGLSRFASCTGTSLAPVPIKGQLPESGGVDAYRLPCFDYDREQSAPQPMASCFLVRTDAWRSVGNMDENFPLYFNDVDYCARLWQDGWEIRYTPTVTVWHGSEKAREGGGTTRRTDAIRRIAVWESHRALLRYWHKHHSRTFGPLYTLLTILVTLGAWVRTGRWGESLGKYGGDTTPADLRRQLEREG